MGLSFHYSGNIAKPEFLAELIAEVQEVAKIQNWEYHIYETEFPIGEFGNICYNTNIYGISFKPQNCEDISICFLSNGKMSNVPLLYFWGNSDNEKEKEYLYKISVKTQFAGVEIHQFIIHLFKHLNNKYFSNFEFIDEGMYWETNDINILKNQFKKYTEILDGFSLALETLALNSDENIEDYIIRMANTVNKNLNSSK